MSKLQEPICFTPILQHTIWGGDAIVRWKKLSGKQPTNIGESWEICDLGNVATVVAEGEHQGQTLRTLTERYGASLLGRANFEKYGNDFPLLIKIIDSHSDLSIQVHPDDAMAQRKEGKPYGKTEMWYIVDNAPNASLVNGFSRTISGEDYEQLLAEDTLTEHLNTFETAPGDYYYIPAGRIHAIGAGNLLIEIQQASDLTYRVYDYNRIDDRGCKRELHIPQAKEALNFEAETHCRQRDPLAKDVCTPLVTSPYFTTNAYHLTEAKTIAHPNLDSFRIFIAFKGEGELVTKEGKITPLREGTSVFLPAVLSEVEIRPLTEGFSFLETYIEA